MSQRFYSISLPVNRAFRWRTLWILVVLLFFGNLAGIPLLRATNGPVEPVWLWGVIMAVSTVLIGGCLFLATRTGLGAPFLEGHLPDDEIGNWARNVFAWAVVAASSGSLVILLMHRGAAPPDYPAGWLLVLASVKAGIQEEIYMRIVLMSFLVWLGRFFGKDQEGRPTPAVFWTAIILCALFFGADHAESRLGLPGATAERLAILGTVNFFFGVGLGWLFWKLGLECAVLAHFAIDALGSAVVVPVWWSRILPLQIILLFGLIFSCALALRVLFDSRPSLNP